VYTHENGASPFLCKPLPHRVETLDFHPLLPVCPVQAHGPKEIQHGSGKVLIGTPRDLLPLQTIVTCAKHRFEIGERHSAATRIQAISGRAQDFRQPNTSTAGKPRQNCPDQSATQLFEPITKALQC
jgi:hypothetical protein